MPYNGTKKVDVLWIFDTADMGEVVGNSWLQVNLIPRCLWRERITTIPGQVISRWEPGSMDRCLTGSEIRMWRVTIWDKRVRKGGSWEIRCGAFWVEITSHSSERLLRLATYRLHLYDLSRLHDFISIDSFLRSVCLLSTTILPPPPLPTALSLPLTTLLSTPTIWTTGGLRSSVTVVLARPL